MGKSKKAPDYATATYNTGGLFGSSTASKKGVDYNPTDAMTSTGENAWAGVSNSLQGINTNDYSNDANFQAYQNQLNKSMTENFDNSVLSSLANRGLMRSSGLQAATNAFNDTLADKTTDLYDSYYNRQSNNLSNNMNVLSQLYNFLTGVNTGAQNQANSVSNYNLQQTQLNNQANAYNNAMYASLAKSLMG
jgi:hypothetical protein